MQGDYYRYISEYTNQNKLEEVKTKAGEAYNKAIELATNLPTTNPVRLGLSLNYSVFCYEVISIQIIIIFHFNLILITRF
jgi:14-3-3 protein epsilon